MLPTAVFTVVLRDYDPDHPCAQRIKKILVGNQEVTCMAARMDFTANSSGTLVLRIPMQKVNIVFDGNEDL